MPLSLDTVPYHKAPLSYHTLNPMTMIITRLSTIFNQSYHFPIILLSLLTLLTSTTSQAQELFVPSMISTEQVNEYAVTFITDTWVCFTVFDGVTNTLMFSKREDGTWSKPVPAPFSGVYSDEYPRFDMGSNRLFFASKRPSENDSTKRANDIWYVELKDGIWSEPVHLGGEFSTEGIDSGANLHQGIVYFHSDRSGSGINDVDLYALNVETPDERATRLSISSSTVDGEPYLFDNGNAILFMSGGYNAVGSSDIFISVKKDGEWLEPEPVDTQGLVNTVDWEYSPTLSPDRQTLYFTRNVQGAVDILQVPVSKLSSSTLNRLAAIPNGN